MGGHEQAGQAVGEGGQAEVEHFEDAVEGVLNPQVLGRALAAVELDEGESACPEIVILGKVGKWILAYIEMHVDSKYLVNDGKM